MKGQRPKPYPQRDLYVYYPGTSRIDNEAAVNVRMRPFSVLAHSNIPAAGAEGVLSAQGGRFAGWSLSGEGLCCGLDSETPVSDLYETPFLFTGALERVIVSVSGKPYENVAIEVKKAFLAE